MWDQQRPKGELSQERGRLFWGQREQHVQMARGRKDAPCGGCKVSEGAWHGPRREMQLGLGVQSLMGFVEGFCFHFQGCENPHRVLSRAGGGHVTPFISLKDLSVAQRTDRSQAGVEMQRLVRTLWEKDR